MVLEDLLIVLAATPTPSPQPLPGTAGDGAPWWGVALIGGLLTLLGSWITLWYGRRKDRREADRAWNGDLKTSAYGFSAAVQKALRALKDHDEDAYEAAIHEAEERRYEMGLLPIGHPSGRAAAEVLICVARVRKAELDLRASGIVRTLYDGRVVISGELLEATQQQQKAFGYFHGVTAKVLGNAR